MRVKVSGTPPDVLFLKLETKCLLGNPLSHARPYQPAARRSFGLPSTWPRSCYRKTCYAPCSMSAKGLSSSERAFLLRFLWQKVKLGRGLPPSCWNNQAHRSHPWLNRFRLLGANWYESTFTSPAISLSFFRLLKAAALEAPSMSVALKDPESASDDAFRHTGFRYWYYTHRAPELNWETVMIKRRRRWKNYPPPHTDRAVTP